MGSFSFYSEEMSDHPVEFAGHWRPDLRSLPSNVRLVDWIPMRGFLNGVNRFIHHGGSVHILTALHAGIPQILLGEVADRPVNARDVVDRGCGIIRDGNGLPSRMIKAFLENPTLRAASEEWAAEMAERACPTEVVKSLVAKWSISDRILYRRRRLNACNSLSHTYAVMESSPWPRVLGT